MFQLFINSENVLPDIRINGFQRYRELVRGALRGDFHSAVNARPLDNGFQICHAEQIQIYRAATVNHTLPRTVQVVLRFLGSFGNAAYRLLNLRFNIRSLILRYGSEIFLALTDIVHRKEFRQVHLTAAYAGVFHSLRGAVRRCYYQRLAISGFAVNRYLLERIAVRRHLLHRAVVKEQLHRVRISGNAIDSGVVRETNIPDI